MDPVKVILKNKTHIQCILATDPQYILGEVHRKGLITNRDYNKLNSIIKGDGEDIAIRLVDTIRNKGRDSEFLKILQEEETLDAYPKLKLMTLEDTETAGSSGSLKRSAERRLSNDTPEIKTPRTDAPYPLTTKPTGLCFIINNEHFGDSEKNRTGTQKDAESLATVFSWLGFQVLMCKDLTKDDMAQVTKSLADLGSLAALQKCKMEEWSNGGFTPLRALPRHGDAFVCCVLSHGAEDVVLGVDGGLLPIKNITSSFDGEHCRVLLGKPKVFFIQACQGRSLHPGLAVDDSSSTSLEDDALPMAFIPSGADFLVAMATVRKYQAIRHTETGSWFIQSLCEQLREGCPSGNDIMQILYRVNNNVSQKKVWIDQWKQIPEVKNVTLRRSLVFSPCSS